MTKALAFTVFFLASMAVFTWAIFVKEFSPWFFALMIFMNGQFCSCLMKGDPK